VAGGFTQEIGKVTPCNFLQSRTYQRIPTDEKERGKEWKKLTEKRNKTATV